MTNMEKTYLQQVAKQLPCFGRKKRKLLHLLKEEMAEQSCNTYSLEELHQHFGSPAEAAEQLMAALPPQTAAQDNTRKRKRYRAALVACFCTIVLLVGYLIWLGSKDIYVPPSEESIYIDDHYIQEG